MDIIIYFIISLFVIFIVTFVSSKIKANKKPSIKQLQVVEQEIDVENRYLLVAIYNNGDRTVLNKDKPLNLSDMEKYFESELEKLCTK